MDGSSISIVTTDLAYNPEQDAFYLYYSTCTQSGKLVRYNRDFTQMTDLHTSSQIFWDPTACVDVAIASRGSKIYLYQDLYLAILDINDNGSVTVERVFQLNGWGGALTRILGRDVTPRYFHADTDGNIYFTDTNPYPDSYEVFRYAPATNVLTRILQVGGIEAQTCLDNSYFLLHQVGPDGYEGFDNASGLYLEISADGSRIERYIGFFPESFISSAAPLGDMRIFFHDWRLNVDDFTSIERENLGGGYERFSVECETFVSSNGDIDQFILSRGGMSSVVTAEQILPDLTEGGPDTRRLIQAGSSVVLFDYYYGQIWEITQ
jgi:hypothetical protein